MRLTDERLDAILQPKSLMHETELESLAREVRELRAECERLRGELRGSNSGFEEYERKYYLELNKTEELTNERDEARELLRRFRALAKLDSSNYGVQFSGFGAFCNVCRDYDARFGQTQQPEPSGELVPWDAETRPRGPMTLRKTGQTAAEFAPGWMKDGEASEGSRILFGTLLEDYEWSRDGITWQRCGVVR